MADVNWNLAVPPDPFKQIAEGRDYSRSIFDQAALLKAGSQYAAGDPASAANTVAARGDFKTAGDLSMLATRRQAGQLYAGGDAAGAGKALAGAGDFETAGKLQEQQIKTVEAQQDALGRSGSFLTAALAQDPNMAQQAWSIAKQQLQAAQIPPERIAEFEKMFAADPKKAAAIMSHIATEVKVTSDGQGTLYLTDKYGNVVNKLGEDTLFGNTAEGKALNIVAKGEAAPNYALAKAYLERQTGQVAQTPSGPLFIQGPRFTVPGQPSQGNQPASPPPGTPAPGTPGATTRVGDRTVTPLPTGNRPIPAAVGAAEDDDIKAILTTSNVDKDMKAFQDMLASGQLVLGPGANAASALRNWSGWSNEASRNYGDFRAAIEQMRNATLLLQKGMQTEGDARRALNEIADNMNDNAYVNQRLERIRGYNARAAQERALNINIRRQRNKSDPFDWTQLQIPDSPYAAPPPGGMPPPGPTQGGDPLAEARDAIARGAPRAAVIQRLRQSGVKFNPGDL